MAGNIFLTFDEVCDVPVAGAGDDKIDWNIARVGIKKVTGGSISSICYSFVNLMSIAARSSASWCSTRGMSAHNQILIDLIAGVKYVKIRLMMSSITRYWNCGWSDSWFSETIWISITSLSIHWLTKPTLWIAFPEHWHFAGHVYYRHSILFKCRIMKRCDVCSR